MIRVLAGGYDLTRKASALTTSNVDPGGYEACSFELAFDAPTLAKGDEVLCMDGLSCVFFGRVEEPGLIFERGGVRQRVSCVGMGAKLKDVQHQQLYIDRDVNRWGPASRARRITLIASGFRVTDPQPQTDPTTGSPALLLELFADGGAVPLCEAWYDAGLGNGVHAVFFNWVTANWLAQSTNPLLLTRMYASLTAEAGGAGTTLEINATATSGTDFGFGATPDGARFVSCYHLYNQVAASSADLPRNVTLTNIAVIGTHGLASRGSGSQGYGYWPSDIVRFAIDRDYDGPIDMRIQDSSGYVLLHHNAYMQGVDLEQVPDDMAKFVGYHWGVWEPNSPFGSVPIFRFQAPPSQPTATCYLEDADSADLSDRLSDSHNQAKVRYRDAAGTEGYVIVDHISSRVPDGLTRTLSLDIGVGSAGAAATFGEFALELEDSQGRAAGSVTLPHDVITDSGPMPAYLLKAGVDRLRVLGLPNAGPLIASDSRRFDTFRIRRISTTWSDTGTPTTQAELDAGSNLLEVIQAQLQVAAQLAGG